MGACGKGVSQCILLTTNTLIFLIAAGGLGISIYIFYDTAAKAMTRMSLLMAVFIASIALMIFSCLGCKTALNAPHKKCSRCLYLSTLLLLFLCEATAAGYIFNLGHALEDAKEHDFDVKVQGDLNKASEDAIVFLHDQLTDLYVDEKCTGGAATGSAVPFNFNKVECTKSKSATSAFNGLLKDAGIATADELSSYQNCTKDPRFTYDGSSKDFTESFCGGLRHIVSLAHKYSRYLIWFPAALAGLTFILLVATICMIVDKRQADRRQRQQSLRGAQEPLQGGQRVQLGQP